MFILVWVVFGSTILGVVAALAWWLILGRKDRMPSGAVALLTAVAVGAALLADVLLGSMAGPSPLRLLPRSEEFARWLIEARFALPLALGIGAVIILAFPLSTHTPKGSASLDRRTPFSFGQQWWFISAIVIVATVLTVTVLAGLVSQPDEQGLWRLFVVDIGIGSVATTMYGWYYSRLALVLLAVLTAVTVVELWLIARPAIGTDPVNDILMRRLRTRNILAVASGALLIHLGTVFASLAGTASLHGGVAAGSDGWAVLTTSVAAIEPALSIAGMAIAALGYALWIGVLLSAMPARRAVRAAVRVSGPASVQS